MAPHGVSQEEHYRAEFAGALTRLAQTPLLADFHAKIPCCWQMLERNCARCFKCDSYNRRILDSTIPFHFWIVIWTHPSFLHIWYPMMVDTCKDLQQTLRVC